MLTIWYIGLLSFLSRELLCNDILNNKMYCTLHVQIFCRFDIIGLGPDSPEDEEGIKASSEICKYGIC